MSDRPRGTPIRILTSVPLCDGHDSAITTINTELVRAGMEVIYLGFHRAARDIVRAAIQEDVRAIGISSYNGGHVEFFTEVVARLRAEGASDIGVFGGGGGTISRRDAAVMCRRGVDRIFFAGEPLADVVRFVQENYSAAHKGKLPAKPRTDRDLARKLTTALQGPKRKPTAATAGPFVIGITGPGGAGKTTLIDELVLRFLDAGDYPHPGPPPDYRRRGCTPRIAILSHDPSLAHHGALLGDRAAMIHAQNDCVFMRSLATRGHAGGLSGGTERSLRVLRGPPPGTFDGILLETVGIGQEAMPFGRNLVDRSIFVMGADYGSRLQLQKIAALDAVDIVVVNKSDLASARTAASELEQRLASNGRGQRLVSTVAKRHRDGGVDELFNMLASEMIDGNAPSNQRRGRRA